MFAAMAFLVGLLRNAFELARKLGSRRRQRPRDAGTGGDLAA